MSEARVVSHFIASQELITPARPAPGSDCIWGQKNLCCSGAEAVLAGDPGGASLSKSVGKSVTDTKRAGK